MRYRVGDDLETFVQRKVPEFISSLDVGGPAKGQSWPATEVPTGAIARHPRQGVDSDHARSSSEDDEAHESTASERTGHRCDSNQGVPSARLSGPSTREHATRSWTTPFTPNVRYGRR